MGLFNLKINPKVPAIKTENRKYVYVFIFVCAGMLFSFIIYYGVSTFQKNLFRQEFNAYASERAKEIIKTIKAYENSLYALAALYETGIDVDKNQFDIFASKIISTNAGIQALEWIPVVPHEKRQQYEHAARSFYPKFEFVNFDINGKRLTAKDSSEYYPVYFVNPTSGNEQAIGFDLGSSKPRLAALTEAKLTGKIVASSRLKLVQDVGEAYGFLLFLPIYKFGSDISTETARQKNIKGFVLGVFKINEIISEALSHLTSQDIGVILKDLSAPQDEQYLSYFSPTGLKTVPDEFATSHSTTFKVDGRTWLVQSITEPGTKAEGDQWVAWSALLNCLFITFLISAYLLSLLTRNEKVNLMVDERTRELQLVTEKTQQLNTELAERTETFEKFVPKEFLHLVGSNSTRQFTKLGEAKIQNLAISFSDIRNFTGIAEELEPKKLLFLVNNYLASVVPIIEKNSGFIDKILGDGIMSVFADATSAIRSAIEIKHYLSNHPIVIDEMTGETIDMNTGVGIHSGPVVVGTVGTNERLQTTVIGNTVNIAAGIEALNKLYKTNVLVSETARNSVDLKSEFSMRLVARVTIKGQSTPINVYESIDALDADKRTQIASSLVLFKEAIRHYHNQKYQAALPLFVECLKICPEDHVAEQYIKEINEQLLIQEGQRDKNTA